MVEHKESWIHKYPVLTTIIVIFTLLIITIIFLNFKGKNDFNPLDNERNEIIQNNSVKDNSQIPIKKEITSASDLALSLSDFPSGWEISTRGDRTKTDVSKYGINLGWIEGYEITFRKIESKDIAISQSISIYPIGNISLVLDDQKKFIKDYDKTLTSGIKKYWLDSFGNKQYITALDNPKVGDDSIAYKYTSENNDVLYYIEFIKDKYYFAFSGYDYELIKELAEKIENKV